jgi:polyisoprenoid-binding protein YceI
LPHACAPLDRHGDRGIGGGSGRRSGVGVACGHGIAGAYRLGPESGRLLVNTTRTGLGAKAGHDLTIEVTRWHGRATVDTADPANSSVTVEVEVDSFEVRQGTGGVKPLTDADRAEIKKTLGEVLHTVQHPTITFRSTRVDGSAGSFTLDGDLTIMGITRPVTVQGRVTDGLVVGSATVVQSRWGIRPYSAFFGVLKLRDEVKVDFDVALTPDG